MDPLDPSSKVRCDGGRWTRRRHLGAWLGGGLGLGLWSGGCRSSKPKSSSKARGAAKLRSLSIQLNWVPEPEFGGFFEGQERGYFEQEGLEVKLVSGTPGVATPQLVASGQSDFGIVTADQILHMRAQGADLVAVFAAFQISPRGILVHAQNPHADLESLWKSKSKVAVEPGQTFVAWLNARYGGEELTLVSSPGSLTTFIHDPSFAQAVYVFAEPAELERRGIPVRIFPVADSGYNPYEVVVATRRELLQKQPALVADLTRALRNGWNSYLQDPQGTNRAMSQKNPAMAFEAMQKATELSKNYIRPPSSPLGSMRLQRWEKLIEQMHSLGKLKRKLPAEPCFWVDPGWS